MKVCWVGVYLSAIQRRLTATPCIDTSSLLHVHHQDETVQEEVKNLEELNWAAVASFAALLSILIIYAIAKKTCLKPLDLPSALRNAQLQSQPPTNDEQDDEEQTPPPAILKMRLRNSVGFYLPKEV